MSVKDWLLPHRLRCPVRKRVLIEPIGVLAGVVTNGNAADPQVKSCVEEGADETMYHR